MGQRRLIRHVTPTARKAAAGTTARVYEGLAREFGVHAEPITLHSPDPELLAGAWIMCREHLVAEGQVPRRVKEAVATAVSSLNRCQFCVDAHAAMLSATGDHATAMRLEDESPELVHDPLLAKVISWASATRSPEAGQLRRPPFRAAHAPEMIGTALLFHYINRPVSVFCGDSPLPGGGRLLKAPMLRVAGRRFRPFARAMPPAGETLELLPGAELPEDLRWAAGNPAIVGAWARFAAAVDRAGETALPAEVRARVLARLRRWNGERFGIGDDLLEQALEGLAAEHVPAARLALLAALSPHRVHEGTIAQYRSAGDGAAGPRPDADVVGAVAWSALAAARRVGSWVATAEPAAAR